MALATSVYTHEGAIATNIPPIQELRRTVLTALLWEDIAYEAGNSVAERIAQLIPKCDPVEVAKLAVEARDDMYLRHVPLFLCRELARRGNGPLVADTLAHVIQRPDELAEYLAIYWKDGKQPLSAGSKRGLARAFCRFDEYQLAKWQ